MGNKNGYDLVCKHCGKVFHHVNKNKVYCSDECKKADRKHLICTICGKEFIQKAYAQKYCSEECHIKAKNMLARNRFVEQTKIDFTGIEGIDYIECKICGQRMSQFHQAHLDMHGISREEYEEKYGKIITYPSKYIEEHFAGENNPNHSSKVNEQIRKERSPFSKKFYEKRGLTEEDRKNFTGSIEREYNTTLEYYVNRGMSEKEAEQALSERQRTFTLEKCIERYGEVEGRLRWEERQDKWKKKMFADGTKICSGQSKACAKLVSLILENSDIDLKYGDNEFRIFDNDTIYLYDITNVSKKKIIEFNGDMWHGNPAIYKGNQFQRITKIPYTFIWQRDKIKKEIAEQNGFDVMVVWESDFYKNEEDVVKHCKDFIL